jgi:hypothetical protein
MSFIQLYNSDNDPVFVDMESGKSFWILPKNSPISNVKYVTHLIEETGKQYYQELESGSVSWFLPIDQFSSEATKNCKSLIIKSRTDCEATGIINSIYDEEQSLTQMIKIDNFIEEKKQNQPQFYENMQSFDSALNETTNIDISFQFFVKVVICLFIYLYIDCWFKINELYFS